MTLDGELFTGRQNFQDTVSIVKTMNSPHWKNVTFQVPFPHSSKTSIHVANTVFEPLLQVFDIPSSGQDVAEDIAWLMPHVTTYIREEIDVLV